MEVKGAVRNISLVPQSHGRIREKFMCHLSSALPLRSIIFLERKWHCLGRRKKKRQKVLLQHSELSKVGLGAEMHTAKSRASGPWDGPCHEP